MDQSSISLHTDETLMHLVREAYRRLTGELQRRLRNDGLVFGHWTALRILWRTDGLTVQEIAALAGVLPISTWTTMHALEDLGLIEIRKLGNEDGKAIRMFLTPKGDVLRERYLPVGEEINRLAFAGVSAEDLEATKRALTRVMENIGQAAEEEMQREAAKPKPPKKPKIKLKRWS